MNTRQQIKIGLLLISATCCSVLSGCGTSGSARVPAAPAFVAAVKTVGSQGEGNFAASLAFRELVASAQAEEAVPLILAAMHDASPRQLNWLGPAVDALCEKAVTSGEHRLAPVLEAFVLETEQASRPRRRAFEWLVSLDPTAAERLVPDMLQDPSVELRRDAVARLNSRAEGAEKAEKRDEALRLYRKVLDAARDQDQIDGVTKKLRELGETVDLALHYGFLTDWKLVGVFDNTEKAGLAKAYGPEFGIKLDAEYESKEGLALWSEHQTEDEMGTVDLNKVMGKKKDALVYALHDFQSDSARQVDLRLATPNAWKIWLNGQLLGWRDEYHRGTQLDHHVHSGQLKRGSNLILLKICQNNQTEGWAQNWKFQLRVCDATGTAVLATNRVRATKDKN